MPPFCPSPTHSGRLRPGSDAPWSPARPPATAGAPGGPECDSQGGCSGAHITRGGWGGVAKRPPGPTSLFPRAVLNNPSTADRRDRGASSSWGFQLGFHIMKLWNPGSGYKPTGEGPPTGSGLFHCSTPCGSTDCQAPQEAALDEKCKKHRHQNSAEQMCRG